jgi:hypothetical protein
MASQISTVPGPVAEQPGGARTRLLLEGPIVSTLLRLAGPNLVVNVVLIAVTVSVDAYFVGQLGLNAVAGLSLVFPLLMLMQQMANASMGGALASSVARAIGAGRGADAAALVVHGLVIACGMAALFSVVVLVGGPWFYMRRSYPCRSHRIFEYDLRRIAGLLATQHADQRDPRHRTGGLSGCRLSGCRSAAHHAGAAVRVWLGPYSATRHYRRGHCDNRIVHRIHGGAGLVSRLGPNRHRALRSQRQT